jgi:hypothetical protein
MRPLVSYFFGCVFAVTAGAAEPTCAVPGDAPGPVPSCAAQPGCASRGGFQRANCTRCQSCQGHAPTCGCQSTCEGTCAEKRSGPPPVTPRRGPELPEEQPVTRETGFYQAPPRTGSFQAPSRSYGMSLGGVTLPEMRLRLPCIELPSISRSRQTARMVMDSTVAPWVSTGYETVGGATAGARGVPAGDTGGGASRGAESQARGAAPADCEDVKRQYDEKLRELQRKIDDCDKLRRCIEDCLQTYPPAAAAMNRTRSEPSQGANAPAPQYTGVGEPQRLPGVPNANVPNSGLSRANYEAPVGQTDGTRQLAPRRLPAAS